MRNSYSVKMFCVMWICWHAGLPFQWTTIVRIYMKTSDGKLGVALRGVQLQKWKCLKRNTWIDLCDFIAKIGTDMVGYVSCVGPHGSVPRDENSSRWRLLVFAESKWLQIAGSTPKPSAISDRRFASNGHMLLVATLKIRRESRRMLRSVTYSFLWTWRELCSAI